jgi:hypothetical protein
VGNKGEVACLQAIMCNNCMLDAADNDACHTVVQLRSTQFGKLLQCYQRQLALTSPHLLRFCRPCCAAEFAEAFSSTVDKCYRLTHKNDIVPAVPASPL